MIQLGFHDIQLQHDRLDDLGDRLKILDELIDFEMFRRPLERAFAKEDRKSPAGRPPLDRVMMFKVLILKRLHNLSDDQTEFQITDRGSFQRFLRIGGSIKAPDAKTIWAFSEALSQKGLLEELFKQFEDFLGAKGYKAQEGIMVDASFVEVPKQRNTRDENEQIKNGITPESFQANPHKKAQKDTDAKWTKKGNVAYYGYKAHVSVDVKYKLIRRFEATQASTHDSQVFKELLDPSLKTGAVWADSAYRTPDNLSFLKARKIKERINEKGYRGHPLTQKQKNSNRKKSRTRARVEHVFGFIENSLGGSHIRTIGKVRAKAQITILNLVYNLCRYTQLCKLSACSTG
jgi:IS5 family transposase